MIKKLVLTPKTNFSSLFTSDQLFGQFVWTVSELEGEEAASSLVRQFQEEHPFLISSLLVDGYLPKPIYTGNSSADSELKKHNKKCKWVSYKDFLSLQKDLQRLSNMELELFNPVRSVAGTRPVIDRISGRVGDGALFNKIYYWSEKPLALYFKLEDESYSSLLEEVVSVWGVNGLGGDRNVGYGQFVFEWKPLSEEEDELFSFNDGELMMCLSRAAGSDLVPFSYTLEVYSGISRKADSHDSYLKKPVVRYLEGSLFEEGKGELLSGVSENPRVCTYGLVFPVSLRIGE